MQKRALTHEPPEKPRVYGPTTLYLLKHLFSSIEFHLVSFQAYFQVPNLLSLGFHLVCEDTHLSREIKQWWTSRNSSPLDRRCETTDPYVGRVAFLFGGWQWGK